MTTLAIIWHSMTGASEALARAAAESAASEAAVQVRLMPADTAQAADLLDANGYLFVFPENLAAISGVMKAFFDRNYYPCLGQIEGRPYALIVSAGSDGSNAVRQAERIATGWRLKKITDSQIVCTHAQSPEAILAPKNVEKNDLVLARDIGVMLATGLTMGIY